MWRSADLCVCVCVCVCAPSVAAALKKLHPEDGERLLDYLQTHALLSQEKARKRRRAGRPHPRLLLMAAASQCCRRPSGTRGSCWWRTEN